MLTVWDYIVIAFDMVLMLAIGGICKHLSKDGSDFFRSGGKMVWWKTPCPRWICDWHIVLWKRL